MKLVENCRKFKGTFVLLTNFDKEGKKVKVQVNSASADVTDH